ncbi:MAG TPA: hypothetical protein VG328_19115 [Stellaceae bacterium]|jgi:hypothetical protein|nr:hypothetical protein [Stellaceae bacterium]
MDRGGASGVHISMHDPRDPALQLWLRSLKPRVELTARYALRAKFAALRCDLDFTQRITELLHLLQPDSEELAAILRDAQLVGQAFQPKEMERPPRRSRRRRLDS